MSKIIKFVHKEWPGLAEWHDHHQNWDQCFIKCKFTCCFTTPIDLLTFHAPTFELTTWKTILFKLGMIVNMKTYSFKFMNF